MITQILKLVFFLQLLSHTNFATMLAGLVEARKGSPSVHRLELGDRHQTYSIYVQYMYMQTLKRPLVLDHNTFHINQDLQHICTIYVNANSEKTSCT